jgi:hypothetical protein
MVLERPQRLADQETPFPTLTVTLSPPVFKGSTAGFRRRTVPYIYERRDIADRRHSEARALRHLHRLHV